MRFEVVFTGLDEGVRRTSGSISPAASRSTSTVDPIVAYEMNGAPLAHWHGFPVRLVVPGWYGMASVKWLTRITAVAEPFTGYQQAHAYRFRRDENDPGEPLTRIFPRALMIPPGVAGFPSAVGPWTRADDDRGPRLVGWAPIETVEVSTDGGATWAEASLAGAPLSGGRGGAGVASGTRRPASVLCCQCPRRGRQRAAGRGRLERRRLRQQRHPARRRPGGLVARRRCVVLAAHDVQRDIQLVADHPAVVPRRDVGKKSPVFITYSVPSFIFAAAR
jgi:DMSO/TMAO reductase YedYZ molybdopterin-dependent catalytic subunit